MPQGTHIDTGYLARALDGTAKISTAMINTMRWFQDLMALPSDEEC